VYTGKAGGAIVIETPKPICAKDAAGIASSKSANNIKRIERLIRIIFPLTQSSLACPVLLCCRGVRGWNGEIRTQTDLVMGAEISLHHKPGVRNYVAKLPHDFFQARHRCW
jgi:hypothetical protein